MKNSTIFLAAMIALAAPAQAADGPAPPPEPGAKGDPLVCRKEAPTGSRFAKKICVRKSELEKRAVKDQGAIKELMDTPQINPPSSG